MCLLDLKWNALGLHKLTVLFVISKHYIISIRIPFTITATSDAIKNSDATLVLFQTSGYV